MWMRTERGKRTDMEFRNITMDEHIQEVEQRKKVRKKVYMQISTQNEKELKLVVKRK